MIVRAAFAALALAACVTHAPGARPPPGRVLLTFEPAIEPALARTRELLVRSALLRRAIAAVEGQVVLPCDLPLRFRRCQDEDATYYEGPRRRIEICYELVDAYRRLFADEAHSAPATEATVEQAALFTTLHELGHALIDVLDLPVTGREEDAADDFALLQLLALGPPGRAAALAAVEQFAAEADMEDLEWWDSHSFDPQRLYEALCLIYGSDPGDLAALVGRNGLPAGRAAECPEEYARKARAWRRLLDGARPVR